jgi:glycine/D-amino acid oxidase-like deaminating enzyme
MRPNFFVNTPDILHAYLQHGGRPAFEIRAVLAERIPAAAGRHAVSKTCMYTTTPDRAFVVGHHPARENVIVACGFSGHGFKFAPVIGEILADLATAGRTGHDISLFHPARFG